MAAEQSIVLDFWKEGEVPELERRFDEDFHIAVDSATLAIDFWSYLNALQASLGWTQLDDRVWDYLEELERDLEPLIERLPAAHAEPYLRHTVQAWTQSESGERDALRQHIAAMLLQALDSQETGALE